MSTGSPLDLYDPLDIIGNGSFGVIRKVRRKLDGVILARKELNFERMSERDRKQIVAEVNILKDLHHDNIVGYHDRFVDRDAGILYILMEYCGGGDLSTVIKQCTRLNRPLPEDTIWSYFFQLLLALQHCHCPNNKTSDSSSSAEVNGGTKRQQILHRDLKPENVFLDGNNTIKLGDFGLSKALGQSNFANTYVGTPYYMSPELMQEKSYDSKSDIWSLGCLIFELCALKPPFHEAKTHSELSMLIRNGRIPPLPKGYSHSLNQIIKAMLNLNPAMRPSAQQLLQHERLDFARKVSDTEKMLVAVKTHKASILVRERELQACEAALVERESHLASVLSQKDEEIFRLNALMEERIQEAVLRREEELRVAVLKREEEVKNAMTKREEEILVAVNKREEEINAAWMVREDALRKELAEAIDWVNVRQRELNELSDSLEQTKAEMEKQAEVIAASKAGRRNKIPLEEVKNLIAPLTHLAHSEKENYELTPKRASDTVHEFPTVETPLNKAPAMANGCNPTPAIPGSAMKGVILTATGEPIATPRSMELTKLIVDSPKVGLNFRKIFDFDSEVEDENSDDEHEEKESDKRLSKETELPSPTEREKKDDASGSHPRPASASGGKILPPTRLRRPSIRMSTGQHRPMLPQSSATWSTTSSNSSAPDPATTGAFQLNPQQRTNAVARPVQTAPPTPLYDTNDEENLPSPFLKRVERSKVSPPVRAATTGAISTKPRAGRRSNGSLLRVIATTNSANSLSTVSPSPSGINSGTQPSPSIGAAVTKVS